MAQDNAVHILNVLGTPTLFDIHGVSLGPIGGGITEPVVLTQPLTIKMAPDSGMLIGKDLSDVELFRLGSDFAGDPADGIPDALVSGGNVFFGHEVAENNVPNPNSWTGTSLVGVGAKSLYSVVSAENVVAVGAGAAYSLVSGYFSVAIGGQALGLVTSSDGNTAVGFAAGYATAMGQGNSWFGNNSGGQLTTVGFGNVALGAQTFGHVGVLGDRNIAIGYQAGFYETGNDHLWIDNRQRSNLSDGQAKALIYGTFDDAVANQRLRINAGHISTPSLPAADPHVLGDQYTDAGVVMVSNG